MRVLTFTLAVTLFLLLYHPIQLRAQDWNQFSPIFERFGPDQRTDFFDQLRLLEAGFEFGDLELQRAMQGLRLGLATSDPTLGIENILNAWVAGRDSVQAILARSSLNPGEVMKVLGEYDRIHGIWQQNLTDLGTAMTTYRDELNGYDFSEINAGYAEFQTLREAWQTSYGDLLASFHTVVEDTRHQPHAPIAKLLDNLFGVGFGSLEMAYGKELGDYRYYHDLYSVNANLFRIGSVPSFRQTWEARWHLQVSWYTAPEVRGSESPDAHRGTNPLLADGAFSLMLNPLLAGGQEGVSLRLLTNLGLELGTYMPAHRDPLHPVTRNNKGKTTGIGPQIGAGFALSTGDLTFYSMGTVSRSEVINCPLYSHTSVIASAGMRFGNVVNVLFSLGESNWAFGENKNARYSRMTVGLLLDSLFRKGGRGAGIGQGLMP